MSVEIGKPFFVCQIYDQEGYYTSVFDICRDSLMTRTYSKLQKIPTAIACSTIYEGSWDGEVPDVSLPIDYRKELAEISKDIEDCA